MNPFDDPVGEQHNPSTNPFDDPVEEQHSPSTNPFADPVQEQNRASRVTLDDFFPRSNMSFMEALEKKEADEKAVRHPVRGKKPAKGMLNKVTLKTKLLLGLTDKIKATPTKRIGSAFRH
jgi:hypothetical protein